MARNYGRFTTSIWRDPDFTALCRAEQALYFMLCTQPEVTAAGTLPLTLRRWAATAAGETVTTVREQLGSLENAGHVVLDEDTEELLIRKFIKWDQGWYNEKRWPLVRDAVAAIASVHIRDIAVDELRRLALSDNPSRDLKDAVWDGACARVRQWLSGRQSRSDRVVVTEVGDVPNPQTTTPEPGTTLPVCEPSPPTADDPRSDFCPDHQPAGTDADCGRCARRRTANEAKRRAALEDEVAAKKAALDARAACQLCDDKGFRLHPTSRQPVGRCDHKPLEAAS